jgi:glycosyltransferase involved in cell wall biosynthesis
LNEPLPGPPLRIAVLGDFDGPHTRRWLRLFVERGHDAHAISYYRPKAELHGVQLHVLSGGAAPSEGGGSPGTTSSLAKWLPPSLLRLIHAMRYQRAGLKRTLQDIRADVFHAHYAVEHGFYGAFAGFHPYVVSAWGSDIFVEAQKPLGRRIARHALGHADLVTANDPAMLAQIAALGMSADRVAVVRLGVDPEFLEGERKEADVPTIISDRALEPLYNIDIVIRAFARLREGLPEARLLIAHDGSERRRLEGLAATLGLGESVRFLGRLPAWPLRDALAAAHVYVSVPSSDSLALSTMEAMAAGAFPIVSDLPSQDGWIDDGVKGLRVPAGDAEALTDALHRALTDGELRTRAQALNRAKVEAEGNLEKNMLGMERHYYRLVGRPVQTGR